jgi:hypothetical protein
MIKSRKLSQCGRFYEQDHQVRATASGLDAEVIGTERQGGVIVSLLVAQ